MSSNNSIFRVSYMSIIVTIHLSFSLSISTIFPEISQQMGYQYLGLIALITMFVSEMLGNIFGQYFIQTKKYNRYFFFAAILPPIGILPVILLEYCDIKKFSNLYCNSLFLYSIIILGQLLLGGGLGIIFLLQNSYTSAASNDQNRDRLFGINYCIIGSSYLLSSLLSHQTIRITGQLFFFYMLMFLQFISTFFFLFIKNQDSEFKDMQIDDGKSHVNSILSSTIDGQSHLMKLQLTLNESKNKLKLKQVKLLLPHFTLTGVVIGLQLGQFYQLIIETLDQNEDELVINKKTYAVFIAVGIGEIISGPFVSIVKGRIKLKIYMITYAVFTSLSIILAIFNSYLKSYLVCFIIGFLWGTLDNFGMNTSVMVITSHWGDSLPMFGIYLFVQNAGIVIYICLSICLSLLYDQSKTIIIGLGVALISSILAVINNIRFYQNAKNDKQSLIIPSDF